jgi:hypothetical protein
MSKVENILKSVVGWGLETKRDIREYNGELIENVSEGAINFLEKYMWPIVKPLDDALEKIRKYCSED